MFDLHNFLHYAPAALRIRTKVDGVIPFKLRDYQKKYFQHLKDDFPSGIIRSIVLKPRQSGFSTLVAGINCHAMCTRHNEIGIMLADKFSRTSDVHGIYSLFVNSLPKALMPMLDKNNSDEVIFDNPNKDDRVKNPGLVSGFKSETAQDRNAGRAGTRRWAHLSEFSFFPYPDSVDEGIQNSIPLAKGTRIFKESTANGVSGIGEAYYSLWNAACDNESIYKPFFVSWFLIDDYQIEVPRGFILTPFEVDLVQRCPEITNANLAWRRLKISEYSKGTESPFTPEERFSADFPSWAEEAFLSTGRPVFDQDKLKIEINRLRSRPTPQLRITITQPNLMMYAQYLKVYAIPIAGKKYLIGADVAEGLVHGDFSSASIIDDNLNQVATFHGHLPPDIFGRILVELGRIYNKALLIPEYNNMGISTLQAIKDMGYLHVYERAVYDELEKAKTGLKLGWRTTAANKQKMLNTLIAFYRENDVNIVDIELLKEMMTLARDDNGEVDLNSKDRVVAMCLALAGLEQLSEKATVLVPGKPKKLLFETVDKSRASIIRKEKLKFGGD